MMRFSKQRDAVLKRVMETDTHPTADWVYDQVRHEFPNVSLGTVYRNLGQLEQEGMIRRIPDGSVQRYDGNLEPHHHFKCNECNRIFDIKVDLEAMPGELPGNPSFKVTDMFLELRGLCDVCQTKRLEGDRDYGS